MGNPESWQLVQRSSSASPRLHSTALVVQRFVVPALSSESKSTAVSSKPGEALAFSSFTPYRHTLARLPSHPPAFTLCRWSGTSCRGAPALRPARRVPEHHLALRHLARTGLREQMTTPHVAYLTEAGILCGSRKHIKGAYIILKFSLKIQKPSQN